ncbi:MAG: DUF362 domain-containing protein [Eubacteriales bacterium]|nr:DUF362 domain-containing protein [Eubacteriales bacterium]
MSVILNKCNEYDIVRLEKIFEEAFAELGGIENYISQGTKVLLKANLLMKSDPDSAVVTNPVFVAALTRVVERAGGVVTVADSPGGFYSEKILKNLYTACGYNLIPEMCGAKLNYDASFKKEVYKIGDEVFPFTFITPFFENDIVISVAKLKTHGFTTYTGAVKNLFGLVPGTYKAEYHMRFPDVNVFSDMLVRLCSAAKPTLSFIDGIVGMEGAGPSGGTPRKVGVVIASDNPHHADMVASKIIGLKPEQVPTLGSAINMGICPCSTDEIEIKGNIEEFVINDYKQAIGGMGSMLNNPLLKKASNYIAPRPVFIGSKCVKCGECVRCCPADAITIGKKKPNIDKKKCIRCFCCQELCPKKAVDIKRISFYLG